MNLGRILGAAATGGASEGVIAAKKAGLFGSQGEMAPDMLAGNQGIAGLNGDAASLQDPNVQAALHQYQQTGDLQAALRGDTTGAVGRALAQDPTTASKMATQQVMDNPLLSGMYGKGGMQDRMFSEEKDLGSRGYSLKPEDYEAYGQASDNTARMFGQEDASLANALQSRGLATGASGAAGVGYSGLAGNKTERLASAQRQIANDRMQMNRQRLNDVRSQLNTSTKEGEQALNDQHTRNSNDLTQRANTFKDSLNAGIAQQESANDRFNQEQNTRPPSLGQVALGTLGSVGGAILGGKQGAAIGGQAGSGLGSALR